MPPRSATPLEEESDAPAPKAGGTNTPWYKGRDLTPREREVFRVRSKASRTAKLLAQSGAGPEPLHPVNVPHLDAASLMPQIRPQGIRSLSLFSGGGGLDVGFDRAGFEHVASYEILRDAAATIKLNRPKWSVFGGPDGDVRQVDWKPYRGKVDIMHGGPPCQPFSNAGRQLGRDDVRDMWPQFVRAVLEVQPAAFVAENVPALLSAKFASYVRNVILRPLEGSYYVTRFEVRAEMFGVPQVRRRIIFVGFRNQKVANRYRQPAPTHRPFLDSESDFLPGFSGLPRCMGVREALGLPSIGVDAIAPTIRSGLTGPRHTTSILNSVAAQRVWNRLEVWPNGVAASRDAARLFVPKNGHFRLSVADCALLQGFPATWSINGAVYMALGQIGNAVAPPAAYAVAKSISAVL